MIYHKKVLIEKQLPGLDIILLELMEQCIKDGTLSEDRQQQMLIIYYNNEKRSS